MIKISSRRDAEAQRELRSSNVSAFSASLRETINWVPAGAGMGI
jgi:hypothetical protein